MLTIQGTLAGTLAVGSVALEVPGAAMILGALSYWMIGHGG